MNEAISPATGPRGVLIPPPAVRRMQRGIALAVVLLPFLGLMLAIAAGWNRGVGWPQITILAVMYFLCMTGITVGFHRYFAHQSFAAGRPVQMALAILGSMAAQGPLLFWVATHRRHHAYSDRAGDPHSPNLHGSGWRGTARGLWHAHIGWMFSAELTDTMHFARDVACDRTLFRVHRLYPLWVVLGLALPAVAGGLWAGTPRGYLDGFLWGGLVRIFFVNHASWCVGSFCHVFGRRVFETHDHSANNDLVAVLTFGEGLQNNHHAFPSSFSHAVRWWEPDLSSIVIRLLQGLGLIWDVKFPSARAIEQARLSSTS